MMSEKSFEQLHGILGKEIENDMSFLNESDIDKYEKQEEKPIEISDFGNRKLTRRERRDLQRKLQKPKYQKIAKKIIKDKSNE